MHSEPIFTQKWASVDMNWGLNPNLRQFQHWCVFETIRRPSATFYLSIPESAMHVAWCTVVAQKSKRAGKKLYVALASA